MREYLVDSVKNNHVFCICEGNAEEEIINSLFNQGLLAFRDEDCNMKERLIREIIKIRAAKEFESQFLQRDYGEIPITILRILDSKKEKFKLSKLYQERVTRGEIRIFDILTRPEIEILLIISEGKQEEFNKLKSKVKPSDFCKENLRLGQIKHKDYFANYYSDVKKLIEAISQYAKTSPDKNELNLYHLFELRGDPAR